MKRLARGVRSEFRLNSPRILRTDLRVIFRKYEIKVDLWPVDKKQTSKFRKIRGAYFNDEFGATIMINRQLPQDPCIFTMAHELKHHLVDQDKKLSYCGEDNESALTEISAEVFAAEFIYPENDFAADLMKRGVDLGQCKDTDLVHLKHDTQTTLSYSGLAKRAVLLGFSPTRSLDNVQWKKLEERLYGIPFYKRFRR